MSSQPISARAIFEHAVELDSAARSAYLKEACQGDPERRAKAEELLDAHFEASSFMAEPACGSPTILMDVVTEQPGHVLGPYKLLEQIGEGGFGVVFMAEQERPVQRRVALKVIKPGMDTRQCIARFEAERQALALMDHPNIARVLDAGATESGRPYFVMELVRGIPITEYCDRNCLTIQLRLQLFTAVCNAVQHAHQKGIIHRDLKPSNVLVTLHDGVPVPKVIDFGVAKATGHRLTDKTLFTAFTQMIGTPLYMSPEQAELSGLDVDTRSDIYSLGVLLYELLTGTTPFDRSRLLQAGYDEMRRIIREEEPPKPSTRLSTHSDQATAVAEHRKTDVRKLGQVVRGELDWIVMKCLEKDRNRRYESASGLSRDIASYLANEPVQACPPSALYQWRKFTQRNKTPIITATLLALTLLTATIVSTWQAVRASRAEALATAQRLEAEASTRSIERLIRNYAWRGRFSDALLLASLANLQSFDSIFDTVLAYRASNSMTSFDAMVFGELQLVAGDPAAALESVKLSLERGGSRNGSFYKTLGWVLLSNGKAGEARDAFQQILLNLRNPEGIYDWSRASPDQLTAGYFLGLISEEQYISQLQADPKTVGFPWFYIGQQHEIRGDRSGAIKAYRRCVQVSDIKNVQRMLAMYRLQKLETKYPSIAG